MTLRCLFVDFDSFFASVEQHDDPRLRGRPVAVVAVPSDTTCCLAASQEAKRLGIKTGTGVREARERCPDIALVLARPARYVEMHHAFMAAIGDCIPTGKAASVDEVPCSLIGRERQRENAIAIARRIKQRLCEVGIGPEMTCSIGIAPNKFLAKTASDMNKPDGLTVIEQADLPHALHGLELRDLCGIGASMEQRLLAAGIDSVERLCATRREHLRTAWGSVEGERFWMQLRGLELPERVREHPASVGHSHVLGPQLRNFEGMRTVLFKLLAKAAMRLRHGDLLAAGLSLRIRFVGMERRFERDLGFAPLDDTPSLLGMLSGMLAPLAKARTSGRWQEGRHPPLSVAVTLTGLSHGDHRSGELMPARAKHRRLSRLLDEINGKHGNYALYFGGMHVAVEKDAAPMRIPFQHVPDTRLEGDRREKRGRTSPATGPRSSEESVDPLYLQRENQFKVLAESHHRRRQEAKASGPVYRSAGTGGWNRTSHAAEATPKPGETLSLF